MGMTEAGQSLILASGSVARRALLNAAGLTFDVRPADVDEAAIRTRLQSADPDVPPDTIAATLAWEKARSVSLRHPTAIVVGADQVLAHGNAVLSKVATRAQAREILKSLRGRRHALISAVTLAQDGKRLWQTAETARLTMRQFSDEYLDAYLEQAGDGILGSVGCYELEGLGVNLFDSIQGDYFTILGLPLFALLGELRRRGVLTS